MLDPLISMTTSSEMSPLEELYQNLPKKRKSAVVDNFQSDSDFQVRKLKTKKSNNKTTTTTTTITPTTNEETLPEEFSNSFVSSTFLFDDSYPFLLAGDNLEPTDEPLVAPRDHQISDKEKSHNKLVAPTLPTISSRIRWDQIRNP